MILEADLRGRIVSGGRFTLDEKLDALKMRKAGVPVTQIAACIGCSDSCVRNWLVNPELNARLDGTYVPSQPRRVVAPNGSIAHRRAQAINDPFPLPDTTVPFGKWVGRDIRTMDTGWLAWCFSAKSVLVNHQRFRAALIRELHVRLSTEVERLNRIDAMPDSEIA